MRCAGIGGMLTFLLPAIAMAQTGYGQRLCEKHLADRVDCRCAGLAFERAFRQDRLEPLLIFKAAEAEHGKEQVDDWLRRMRLQSLREPLQRLDAMASSKENCTRPD
jgi:hypothetical protein